MKESRELFFHRDLSWLSFNERVLEEALDTANPLLERVRFLSIAANNLDEFFMVRVAGLKRLIDAGHNHKDSFGYYPAELFADLSSKIALQFAKLYSIYAENIDKDLQKNKIFILNPGQLNGEQKRAVKKYFETTLFPIITPMAIDQSHPFPVLHSKTNVFALYLGRWDETHLALMVIPRSVPRLFKLPSEKDEFCFIFIDEIIRENLENFFRGYKILDSFAFRIIRDGEFSLQEEYASDLLKAIDDAKTRAGGKIIINID